ncbi:LOW QUALITY PROTEIN: ornithine decarboxylase, partial [Aplysia californica]|uniref:LOW QUALITY PROTEIN: ornithine decarboxylase n=1 Tax=Aplysia californica TaxID=6500 RepID=A0ABM1VQZ2_APLCA
MPSVQSVSDSGALLEVHAGKLPWMSELVQEKVEMMDNMVCASVFVPLYRLIDRLIDRWSLCGSFSSFHEGSLPSDERCFSQAIREAHAVFSAGHQLGFDMDLLDIGGGFPGVDSDALSSAQVAQEVSSALEQYFPPSSGVRIVAEPGRYFVTSAFTLVVNVIAKRVVNVKIAPMSPRLRRSVVWGPTCDGLDFVIRDCRMPELGIGQWLYFRNQGAYTVSLSCDFNGIPRPRRYYVCCDTYWNKVYPMPSLPRRRFQSS